MVVSMPSGMHASGKPTVEVIFTVLHAGGKFGGKADIKHQVDCMGLVHL